METKTIKISADLHKKIKVKASTEGKTMSEWLEINVKDKLRPSKREIILDAMTARPLLKLVYDEIPIDGISPDLVIQNVINKNQAKNPRITEGLVDQVMEKLSELGATKQVRLKNPPTLGYRYRIRKLDL